MEVFWSVSANGHICVEPRAPQHLFMVENANHVSARLLVHDNIIATLLTLHQDFMRPAIGSSNVLHVVDSSTA